MTRRKREGGFFRMSPTGCFALQDCSGSGAL
jgi:hypothetical protein